MLSQCRSAAVYYFENYCDTDGENSLWNNFSPSFQYTQKKAGELGVRGWIRNTQQRTVKGQLEGEEAKVENMYYAQLFLACFLLMLETRHGLISCPRKDWLRTTGSPSSRIDEAVFKGQKSVAEYSFQEFEIRR